MDVILPIHAQFSRLIYSGEKIFEFRNRKIHIEENERAYIYETKKSGIGKITGYFLCGKTEEIPRCKSGTYQMLPYFVDRFGTEEEKNAVREAMEVSLYGYDNFLVLYYMFNHGLIKELKTSHTPPSWESLTHYSPAAMKEYMRCREKADGLCKRCDEWLKRTGFFDEYGESNWKYRIPIKEAVQFETPKDITDFILMDGRPVKTAPQSFCYTRGFTR